MKKFIILALLVTSLFSSAESAGKTKQTNIKNTVDTEKIDEELELADNYYYGKRILKARDLYEKYSPVSDEAKMKLAKYYVDDMQSDKAVTFLEELAKKKNKEALSMLASIYFSTDSEDKLLKLFNKKSNSEMKQLAEIYESNGYSEKASEIYRTLAINGDEDAYYQIITQYGSTVSLDLLKLEAAKGNNRANKELGSLYADSYEYKDAVVYYKKYLKKAKGDSEIFRAFGEYYSKEELKKELDPYIKRGDKGAKDILDDYLLRAEEGNVLDSEEESGEFTDNEQKAPEIPDETISETADEDESEQIITVKTSFEENEKIYLDRIAEDENDYEAVNELLSLYYLNDKKEKLDIFIDGLINDGYYLGLNWKIVKNRAVPIYEEYIAQGINRAKPVLAEIYIEEKELEKALSIYESMLPAKNSDINLALASLYNKTGKYDKTLDLIKSKGIDLDKELKNSDEMSRAYDFYDFYFPMLRYGAYAYYKLEDYDKAKNVYSYLSEYSSDYGHSPFVFLSDGLNNPDDSYYPDKIYLLDIYKKTNAKDEYDELEKQLTSSSDLFYGDSKIKQSLADYYASNGEFDKAKKLLLNDKSETQTVKFLNIVPLVLGLLPNADFFGNSEQIANITIKYKNYNEIKSFIDEVLVLTNNSYDNSKNYLNSVKIAGLYIVKQYSDELQLSDSFNKKFLSYSDNTLKREFKKSYKNLYKNKKGVPFYPSNPESNFILSMLLKEWNVETKTLSGSEDPAVTFSRRKIFENGILFFTDKYVKEFSKINDIMEQDLLNSFDTEDENILKNSSSKIGNAMDQFFSKTNFTKDYKEFYNLLPSMILLDIRENLEKNNREDMVQKLNSDYKSYLSEDKIRIIERIKESNTELSDKTNSVFNFMH